MAVSFHADEPGLNHQAKMPEVPPPEKLPSDADMREKLLPTMPDPVRRYYERERPIELRPVEFERYLGKKIPGGQFNIWIRTTGKLPDPSHPSFLKAVESLTAGDIDSAHAQLSRMLDIYRDSPHATEARRIIGEINMDRLFSRNPMPGKRDYVVKPGDSLLRIEKGSLTTIPFLRALNKLSSTVLQPG